MDRSPDVTELLARSQTGDREAANAAFAALYAELHAKAAVLMRNEPRSCMLQPTALVGEAWLRVGRDVDVTFVDRNHFLRLAARAMRNALIDHARRRRALRRSAPAEVPMEPTVAIAETTTSLDDLIDLHESLERLESFDPQLAEIVTLRYFAGLTLAEIGDLCGQSAQSVHRAQALARAWLARDMGREPRVS
ncbi:MAG: ECF-type sigma factor [Planctomycetota bacterium]